MKAAIVPSYGPADVIRIEDRPDPALTPTSVLVQIHASVVTTGDWRLRAAAFPKGLRLVGRLVSGLTRPRHEIPGVTFSGEVIAIGPEVTRYQIGDAVFGAGDRGGHAELIALSETAALALKPTVLSHAQAAALPFGAATSHLFLTKLGKLSAGERILITGASGGVGHLGVQLAKALGAHVTTLSSSRNLGFLAALCADTMLSYETVDITQVPRASYDVVFDTIGLLDFAKARPLLVRNGRYLTIEGSWRELGQMMVPCRAQGHKIAFCVSMPDHAQLEHLAEMAEAGHLAPVIEQSFPLSQIADAHRAVETRHRSGVIALEMLENA